MVAIGSDNKKKLYLLGGLAGVLGILVLVVVRPFGGGSSDTPTSPAANTANAAGNAASNAAGKAPGPGGTLAGGPGAVGAMPAVIPASAPAPAASTVGLPIAPQPARRDPFMPYYTATLPPPKPTPPPLPPPPPITIPGPSADSPVQIPNADGSGGTPPAILSGLPAVKLPKSDAPDAPPDTNAPAAVNLDGNSSENRSTDKRLSGVVIGDSISALLEISTGTETITRVVRPGDEVDGLKILRIGRTEENGVQTTRMYVLENGQERYFDLRPR